MMYRTTYSGNVLGKQASEWGGINEFDIEFVANMS